MKCCKKKSLVTLLTTLAILGAVVGCIVLFFPRSLLKGKNSPRPDTFSEIPILTSVSIESDAVSSCNGEDCPIKYPLAEEAAFRKSCSSEDCVLAAARMIRWIDKTEDPCDDFYNYSCGNFIRAHALPEGWDVYGSMDVRNEDIDLKIKNILEEPAHENDSHSLNSTKQVYSSCMNLTQIDEWSLHDLRYVLTSAGGIGEWPFLKPNWKDCRLDLEWRMAKLNAMGIDSLFRLETDFSDDDNRLQAVMSAADPLVGNICYNETSEITLEHRALMQSVLELLEVPITNDTESDMDDVLMFEFLFCNATKVCRSQKNNDEEHPRNRVTLLQLADISSQINWMRWRNIVFSELRLNFPHDKQNIFVDGVEDCIEGINELLSEAPSKTVANYLTWKFVFHHLGFLGKPFRQVVENHRQLLNRGSLFMHSDRWIPRWRQCVIYIKDIMPMGILKTYHDIYHEDEIDKAMDDIVTRVKNEFRLIMKDTRDLLENDRIKSYHKIDQVQVEVAYPTKEDRFYDKFYSSMGPMSDSFLENGMRLLSLRMRKLMEGVSSHKSAHDMEYAIQTLFPPFFLNAYSFFRGNSIIVTLAQLLHSVTSTLPKFKTMSTFGFSIGHELAHGFDLQALNGIHGTNWTSWPSYVLKQAQKRAHCFQQSFPYPKANDSAEEKMIKSILNEDLCYHQGMNLAFEAYLNYLNKHGDEEILPGLPLSNEKLFFISYAQESCEIRNDHSVTYDTSRRRVNQVLKNLPAFSEAFRCPTGKPMNAAKCRALWV